jgi:hypothetical protein
MVGTVFTDNNARAVNNFLFPSDPVINQGPALLNKVTQLFVAIFHCIF